jgi:AmmeMemoRadiSam system protein B
MQGSKAMSVVREAAVAGHFYPGSAGELRSAVERYLGGADAAPGPRPKALIVPHAGYVYSGPVAASAYARLAPWREQIRRVVLLGPCHRIPVRGLAASSADFFRTPLGDVALDRALLDSLDLPGIEIFDDTHTFEHSLEVHLPFLQMLLEDFMLVPFVVGHAEPETVAAVLEALGDGPDTLIVISSDLSHYLPYDAAKERDSATCRSIERFEAENIGPDDACGCSPMGGLLVLAKRRGMSVDTLDLRNSADTAGPMEQVVGYGSWMFLE